MNTCITSRRLSIDISYDRSFHDVNLTYIDSVCSALIESRFGAGYQYEGIRSVNGEPTSVPVVRDGIMPACCVAYSRPAFKRPIDAVSEGPCTRSFLDRETPVGVFENAMFRRNAVSTANALGRGSPANGPPAKYDFLHSSFGRSNLKMRASISRP